MTDHEIESSRSTYVHRPWHSLVLMAIGCGLIVYVIGAALNYWPGPTP